MRENQKINTESYLQKVKQTKTETPHEEIQESIARLNIMDWES